MEQPTDNQKEACVFPCPAINYNQVKELPNAYVVNNYFYGHVGNIETIAGVVHGNVSQHIETIYRLDSNIANLLTELLKMPEIKPQAEELTANLAEYASAKPSKRQLLKNKLVDGAKNLITLSETYEKIKPMASAVYEGIKQLMM